MSLSAVAPTIVAIMLSCYGGRIIRRFPLVTVASDVIRPKNFLSSSTMDDDLDCSIQSYSKTLLSTLTKA